MINDSCADETFCIKYTTGTLITRTENITLLCVCENCNANEPLSYAFQLTGYYPLTAANVATPSISAHTFTSSDFVALQVTGKCAAQIAVAQVSQVSTPAHCLCRRSFGRRHHRGWHRSE